MGENTHRRIISRNQQSNQSSNQSYNEPYGSVQPYNITQSSQYQHYCTNVSSCDNLTENRKKNINLKQIKNITTSCAKSLTNKLITLSNSLTHSSSSSNYYSNQSNPYSVSNTNYNTSSRQYGGQYSVGVQGVAANYGNKWGNQSLGDPSIPPTGIQYIYTDSRPSSQYGINNIINRITTTDNIRTHRELVIIIEYCLSFKDFLIEINIEKDRFGAPTMESINKFSIINTVVRDKIMQYITNRKDCCIFVIKFITWKMRCTKKPEEIILSLELLFSCLKEFGGYFLILFTKSLMKTLRKLLFVTNFKSSITSNVKKKITKILVGKSNYIHPGISTDIRIHIFKSKILYNIQLYYELYLFEQDQYVVFYDGYKDMRLRGIKFPTINEHDKLLYTTQSTTHSRQSINTIPSRQSINTIPSSRHQSVVVGDTVGTVIGLEELDELLYNINNNNYTLEYINGIRSKLINSINILSNKPTLNNHQSQLLDKILKLNDSLLLLTTTDSINIMDSTEKISTKSAAVVAAKNSSIGEGATTFFAAPNTNTNTNTMDNIMDNMDSVNSTIGRGEGAAAPTIGFKGEGATAIFAAPNSNSMDNSMDSMEGEVDLDEIFNFINFNEKNEQLIDEEDDEDEEELINNFINLPNSPVQSRDNSSSINTLHKVNSGDSSDKGDSVDISNTSNSVNSSDRGDRVDSSDNISNIVTNKEENKSNKEVREKNISELVSELDNLEMDFGHMSMNNF